MDTTGIKNAINQIEYIIAENEKLKSQNKRLDTLLKYALAVNGSLPLRLPHNLTDEERDDFLESHSIASGKDIILVSLKTNKELTKEDLDKIFKD